LCRDFDLSGSRDGHGHMTNLFPIGHRQFPIAPLYSRFRDGL